MDLSHAGASAKSTTVKKLKRPEATMGRSLALNSQANVVSRNAACSNIGRTLSGGSTRTFKWADPPFRITSLFQYDALNRG